MRMLLTPYLQRDLGVVLLRPGRDLLHYFSGRARVLIGDEPEQLKAVPSGMLPAVGQELATDARLAAFFRDERVLAAAGGPAALREWVMRGTACQWTGGDGYHHEHMDALDYGGRTIRLCWHHEHILREQALPALESIAARNVADFVVYRALMHFQFEDGHQLSLPELCWWAVLHQVTDALPEAVARVSLRWQPAVAPHGTMREADITCERPPAEIINERVERVKPVLAIDVDPEPQAGFMLRPKLTRWICEKYTQWVKSQPCCCGCGRPADDPHHIVDLGLGGTGTKPHDIFTIPLTRECHDELHEDVAAWEAKHGSQLLHLVRTLNRAFGLGAIVTATKRGAKR